MNSQDDHCVACPALASARTCIVAPTPCPKGGLLCVGEAPGAQEDASGEGFVGQAGRVLDRLLAAHGLLRYKDWGVANLIRCRPPGNRKPSPAEMDACLPKLAGFIAQVRPSVILLVGGVPTETFLGKGGLFEHIRDSRVMARTDMSRSHPGLASLRVSTPWVIPMPHTSGLCWNHKAPDGRAWSEIGQEQVAQAVRVWRLQNTTSAHE